MLIPLVIESPKIIVRSSLVFFVGLRVSGDDVDLDGTFHCQAVVGNDVGCVVAAVAVADHAVADAIVVASGVYHCCA